MAIILNTNAVKTWYQAPVMSRQCPVSQSPQDVYTPSTASSGIVSYKDMLNAAKGGATANAIAANDYGVDDKGKALDPKTLAKAPITSTNEQMQSYLNFLYTTETGKAELDALKAEHPDAKVVVGQPKGYNWGKDQGGVTIGETIYINPKTMGNDPLDGAGLLAHEVWHALSPYKNSFAQEKTADDMRVAVTQDLEKKHYGEGWAKAHGGVGLAKDNVDDIYADTFSEYDGGKKPKAGDLAAESMAVESRKIPLPDKIVKHSDGLFNKKFPKTTTAEVKD